MQTGIRCYTCRELGHIARFCGKNRRNTYYERASRCNRCDLYGHTERDCGEYFTQSIQCYRCQRFGHLARNCRTPSDVSQSKNANHSARNYQYSTHSKPTVRQSLNSAALGTAQQYASRTARVSSAKIVQHCQDGLRKQKAVATFLHSTSDKNSTTTKLEALANELLFSLFEYLSTVHLVNAFHGLNDRIDALLVVHCRTYYLDFRSVSKPAMSLFCKRYLPSNINRTVSLCLSNGGRGFKQTEIFMSHKLNLYKFINLRSLSLCGIRSEETMNKMMNEWPYLPCLTHLKLAKCYCAFGSIDTTRLSNSIWSLSKLTHCCLDTEEYVFRTPRVISLSLEYVAIQGHSFRLNQLALLVKKTPHLRSMCIRHHDIDDDKDYLSSPLLSVTVFKLFSLRSRPVMMNLLQNMPNLKNLTVETFYLNLDGYQWEKIIVQYLFKLRIFRLKMHIQLTGIKNNEQQLDILFNSFRSPFWIEQRRWFVRCHSMLHNDYREILIYTLPLVFVNLDKNMMKLPYKSTCPYDKSQ
ncbi:unnamed protein product [Rotaria socialis]|uniref:CCHC-type domain-containing protein n=2 Tax=Rotaria socialis TaxID=392032 RepID=A0A818DR94_9BILA|nr:unnamed protein product [Rotaria socialis]CAF3451918.1 unnamed protein product [Rotaria socialis]